MGINIAATFTAVFIKSTAVNMNCRRSVGSKIIYSLSNHTNLADRQTAHNLIREHCLVFRVKCKLKHFQQRTDYFAGHRTMARLLCCAINFANFTRWDVKF